MKYKSLLPPLFSLLLSPAIEADWSLTKIITLNHIGSPSENDGFHPEAFNLEKAINDKAHYSIGILENSEERLGLTAGYSRVFYQRGRLDLTGNFYLSSNYRRLPFIVPVPTLGIRYHLTPRTDLLMEAVPFHDEGDPYLIFITGINFDL
ncbi:MAG: hypothetical protein KJ914_17940 [Gammaproteobacteria bacterium]|nr:hypothetical protein [Gammaproteobacteria bacterium]MBU1724243.1 hypothetical protein [Gammaproteobacteria bacterium]MBU2006329.1 hypothetical protein [Gammaproteobacteria bacterium]